MYTFDLEKNMFCDNPIRFDKLCSKKYLIDKPIGVIGVENGIILPCRKIKNTIQKSEGGVTNQFGEFIAGHKTYLDANSTIIGWDCIRSYKPEIDIVKENQTVIFGGCLIVQFGHFITEGFSRLWYLIQNPELDYKIIFLTFPGYNIFKFENILNSIGIKKDQYEIITKPTQFKKIIIPEQSIYIGSGYLKEHQLIYDAIISRTKPSEFKKIYLSKSKFHINNSVREVYFEEFYQKRGFEIIYPETLTFIEQVAILNGADEVVCTMGTIQHLTFFCRNHVKVTIMAREYNSGPINVLGMFSLQMRNTDSYFVDIALNFLPTTVTNSIYLHGPTKHWVKYLDSQKIPYEASEISFDKHVKPFIYDYLINWTNHYIKNPNAYSKIKNQTLPDLINNIQKTFLCEANNMKNFPERDDVINMQNQINLLSEQLEILKKSQQQQISDKLDTLLQKIYSLENNISPIDQEHNLVIMETIKNSDKIMSQLEIDINDKIIKQLLEIKSENSDNLKLLDNAYKSRTKDYYKVNGQLKWARVEIDNIHNSFSYKLGRFLTWIPRKIMHILK